MSNDRPDGTRSRLARLLVVLVTALLVTSPLTGAVSMPTEERRTNGFDRPTDGVPPSPGVDGEQRQEPQRVDSCTDITEPGRYELVHDLRNRTDDVCIHIRANDVVFDGNGHAITGNQSNDSAGVFVYNASQGAPHARNESLSSVTVQNLTVADWEDGVVVGDIAGIGTEARLRDVLARNNTGSGVRLTETEGGLLENVTATGNWDGLTFWEVHGLDARNVNASGNDQLGLGLFQNVENNTFRNVTATDNGPDGYASGGVYLSTDVVGNLFEGIYVADNDGPGVRFSDSFQNVIRDAVVESNANRGIFGSRASSESLQNVTVRDNGGPELELVEGGLDAEGLHLGRLASLSFREETVVVEPFDSDDLSSEPPGTNPADRGVEVSNVDDEVTLTFEYEGDGASVRLWRFDGTEWVHVSDATVDDRRNTITGTVNGDGRVLTVESSVENDTGTSGTGVSGTDATFVIQSLREDADFDYQFVVDGTVEPHETDEVAADSDDRIEENVDGSVTVTGSTGDAAGDAFLVSGEILEFSLSGADSGFELSFDGQDVTDELTDPDERTTVSGTDATFVIESLREDADFDYEFVVEGTAEPHETSQLSADSEDRVQENDDGTVTVTGSTGDAAGDAFLVSGEIVEFSVSGVDSGYRLTFDGEDVTEVLTAADQRELRDDGTPTGATLLDQLPTHAGIYANLAAVGVTAFRVAES